MKLDVNIAFPSPRRVTTVLLTIIAALLALSLAGQFLRLEMGYDFAKGFIPLFYVDFETNIPTWYSSMALMLAAFLSGILTLAARKPPNGDAVFWAGIFFIFALLSLDEIAMIHEMPIDSMKESFEFSGFLGYPWVIPASVVVMGVALLYLRFVLRRPPLIRNLIILSGIVFVGGAIGVEMVSAWWVEQSGTESWPYVITVTIEEGCEMTGIAIFIHALMLSLHEQVSGIHLTLQKPAR